MRRHSDDEEYFRAIADALQTDSVHCQDIDSLEPQRQLRDPRSEAYRSLYAAFLQGSGAHRRLRGRARQGGASPSSRDRLTQDGGLSCSNRPLFMIGRRTSADRQHRVAREHAEIALEDGRYLLRDRGSRYGTFVNGEQITERTLQHGDRIRLGRTEAIELVFMTESAT